MSRALGRGIKTVRLCRRRCPQHGIAGIEKDAPRGGECAEPAGALVQQIIHQTLHGSAAPQLPLEHTFASGILGDFARDDSARLESPRDDSTPA